VSSRSFQVEWDIRLNGTVKVSTARMIQSIPLLMQDMQVWFSRSAFTLLWLSLVARFIYTRCQEELKITTFT